MNQSFTAMTDAGLQAVQDASAASGEPYSMELNRTDFNNMVAALTIVADLSDGRLSEWAEGFISSIAETLGVEFI